MPPVPTHSDVVAPSNSETDQACYGEADDITSGYNQVGWYIYMPLNRRKLIAFAVGLPTIYCVGVRRDNGRIFIQTSQLIDPRNGFLEYVEVTHSSYRKVIMDIINRPYTDKDRAEQAAENQLLMNLAGCELL